MGRPPNDIADVFKFIDTKDGDENVCWPWTGALSGRDQDRGYFSVNGKKWLAYRLVYTLVHGEIEDKQLVRHTCDNPMCCNPKHMELGTQSENEQDKYRRDRMGLPVAAVRDIKRLLTATKLSQRVIAQHVAEKYGVEVSREAVRNIKLGVRRNRSDERTAEEVIGATAFDIEGDGDSD